MICQATNLKISQKKKNDLAMSDEIEKQYYQTAFPYTHGDVVENLRKKQLEM